MPTVTFTAVEALSRSREFSTEIALLPIRTVPIGQRCARPYARFARRLSQGLPGYVRPRAVLGRRTATVAVLVENFDLLNLANLFRNL